MARAARQEQPSRASRAMVVPKAGRQKRADCSATSAFVGIICWFAGVTVNTPATRSLGVLEGVAPAGNSRS